MTATAPPRMNTTNTFQETTFMGEQKSVDGWQQIQQYVDSQNYE